MYTSYALFHRNVLYDGLCRISKLIMSITKWRCQFLKLFIYSYLFARITTIHCFRVWNIYYTSRYHRYKPRRIRRAPWQYYHQHPQCQNLQSAAVRQVLTILDTCKCQRSHRRWRTSFVFWIHLATPATTTSTSIVPRMRGAIWQSIVGKWDNPKSVDTVIVSAHNPPCIAYGNRVHTTVLVSKYVRMFLTATNN